MTFNSTTNLVSLYLSTSFFSKGGRFSCVARAVPAETCDCGVKGQVSTDSFFSFAIE